MWCYEFEPKIQYKILQSRNIRYNRETKIFSYCSFLIYFDGSHKDIIVFVH